MAPLALAASVFAESSQKAEEGVPSWLIGLGAFVILAFLLFVTTQFNRDR
ncbi:MAG: hypothetical protein ACTHMZ_01855 [Actinomycetes bacterium]